MPAKYNCTELEMLRLVRSKEEWAVGYLFNQLDKFLKNYLRTRNPDYLNYSNLIASQTVTIIIEKETEPQLTCKLLTFAISIAKRQWSLVERKKHEVLMPDGFFDTAEAIEDAYIEVENSDRRLFVNRCLQRITEKCKRLLSFYCNDIKPEEAFQEMGYSSKKVYQVKKSECMDRLKQVIEQSPEYKELFNLNQEDTTDERN